MSEPLSLERIAQMSFKPSKPAEDFLEHNLRANLMPGEKYNPARLAIARSLLEPEPPEALAKGTLEFGNGIKGGTLLGDQKAVWACLIADSWPEPVETEEAFRAAVESHWHRGARLLKSDLAEAHDDYVEFAVGLAALAGLAGAPGKSGRGPGGVGASRVSIRFGEVSIDVKQNAPVNFSLNDTGSSPHIAVMGKIGSGKTRTGIEIADQILSSAHIPMLFIDPKGEFVKDGVFVKKSEWGGRTFADRFPGTQPLDVGHLPVPLDFLSIPPNATPNTIQQLAAAFRDSFQKCIRVKGDVALGNLREVVLSLLNVMSGAQGSSVLKPQRISLRRLHDALRERNEDDERGKDSIEARLSELADLNLFEPRMAPEEFFSQSWVIGLGATNDAAKKLVMFLLLDALSVYVMSQQDAPTDLDGHRQLRHLLVIDEAREVLSYKHGALSQLLRKARSKGQVVMLLSQSPDDFDKEDDDFLSQMGTVAVFASSTNSVKSLRSVMGKKVRPEDLTDAALGKGVALAKLPGRDPTRILAWR